MSEWVRSQNTHSTRTQPRFDGINAVPFSQGDVPLRGIITTLRRQDYEGYVVLETAAFGDPRASAQHARTVLLVASR